MYMAFAVLIISGIVVYRILPGLIKDSDSKTIVAFSLLLLTGVVLNIAINLNVHIASPLNLIIFIFKPVSEFLKTLLLK